MPRYVILTHDHPFLHWDFMLEQDGALRTWRLAQAPNSTATIMAESLSDHRLEYLEYEGPVSNNRGHVEQWDRGEFTIIEESDSELNIRLKGQKLSGLATITLNDEIQECTFRFETNYET